MTLTDYLKREQLTDQQFADRIGVDRSTITRIRANQFPSKKTLEAITKATGGAVTANDFLAAA